MDADAFTGKSSDWERWSNALELHIKTRGGALLWDAITGAAITSTTYDEGLLSAQVLHELIHV